jgi:hypothetical protein
MFLSCKPADHCANIIHDITPCFFFLFSSSSSLHLLLEIPVETWLFCFFSAELHQSIHKNLFFAFGSKKKIYPPRRLCCINVRTDVIVVFLNSHRRQSQMKQTGTLPYPSTGRLWWWYVPSILDTMVVRHINCRLYNNNDCPPFNLWFM